MLKQNSKSKQTDSRKFPPPKPSGTKLGTMVGTKLGTMVGSGSASQFSTKKVPKIKGIAEKDLEEDSLDQPILLSTKQVISNQIERLRFSKEEVKYKQYGLTFKPHGQSKKGNKKVIKKDFMNKDKSVGFEWNIINKQKL